MLSKTETFDMEKCDIPFFKKENISKKGFIWCGGNEYLLTGDIGINNKEDEIKRLSEIYKTMTEEKLELTERFVKKVNSLYNRDENNPFRTDQYLNLMILSQRIMLERSSIDEDNIIALATTIRTGKLHVNGVLFSNKHRYYVRYVCPKDVEEELVENVDLFFQKINPKHKTVVDMSFIYNKNQEFQWLNGKVWKSALSNPEDIYDGIVHIDGFDCTYNIDTFRGLCSYSSKGLKIGGSIFHNALQYHTFDTLFINGVTYKRVKEDK